MPILLGLFFSRLNKKIYYFICKTSQAVYVPEKKPIRLNESPTRQEKTIKHTTTAHITVQARPFHQL